MQSMIMNQTQPILLSQPHLKGKHTLCAQIVRGFKNIYVVEKIVLVTWSPFKNLFLVHTKRLGRYAAFFVFEHMKEYFEHPKSERGEG